MIALVSLAPLNALAAPVPATIAYRIPGQDPLSIEFRKTLDARIAKDRQLRLIDKLDAADLKVVSPARTIDWDTLGGRMVVIYILDVKSRTNDFRLSGVCYADDMDKCARDLLGRSKHFALGL